MDKYCMHKEIDYAGRDEYYLFTCSIPNASSMNNFDINTNKFRMQNGFTYNVTLTFLTDKVALRITSETENLKRSVSMFIGSETFLLPKKSNATTSRDGAKIHYDMIILSSDNECFQKLKQHPNDI
ncbi:hypothetical protein AVEN_30172-1 [Araneus ventricosus]|uniref:Uncharacterized protein n=1 Tax=Araneus ventricosus TaxID=182803 RepID=A0A4Y2KR11_ARAVE|nr:hypothetical protein AVEN_30172-1 [Araneus ventricosus]